MSPKSQPLSPSDFVIYTQYNNLRDDILDPNEGHTHTGEEGGGAIIYARAYVSDTAPSSPFAGMIWLDTDG